MGQFSLALTDAALAAVILLPLFYLLEKRCFHSKTRAVWYFFLAVYLAGVYGVTGLPDILYIRPHFNVNLKPFAYLFSYYREGLLNILLLIPLGCFLTMLWKPFRNGFFTILFGFCLSLAVELLQLLTYRATDVNDLMTNTLGAFLGWILGRIFLKCFPKIPSEGKTAHVFVVLGASWGVMFFLQPFLARLIGILFI